MPQAQLTTYGRTTHDLRKFQRDFGAIKNGKQPGPDLSKFKSDGPLQEQRTPTAEEYDRMFRKDKPENS